jgi:hypothetical protein
MVLSEGDMSLKNPVPRPGIDPGTVRLVGQRLNHYATPGPGIRKVSDKFLEKIKTQILCSVFFFYRAVDGTMWKNIVDPDRLQMTIYRMRIACWIRKAIHTHSEFVKLIPFPQQQWFNERASKLRYAYIACLVCNCICEKLNPLTQFLSCTNNTGH